MNLKNGYSLKNIVSKGTVKFMKIDNLNYKYTILSLFQNSS